MPSRLYSYTTGFCAQCGDPVTARIVRENDAVWQETLCPVHGESKALISSDTGWFEAGREYVKPRQIPFALGTEEFRGCPDSCGLCPQHRQHTCLPVVEITSRCNLECPVCLKPPNGEFGMTPDEFRRALSRLIDYEGSVPLLNLSGGEPTMH
ncbi:MAG: radical SAM protein, partial [Candidatus Accumulibacter sp.]|nr:radical SAM protein [Accumulibacter sp.]